jgi:hypothetical protein
MCHWCRATVLVLLLSMMVLASPASAAPFDRVAWIDGEVDCRFSPSGETGPGEVTLLPTGERAKLTMWGRKVTAQVDYRYSWVWTHPTGAFDVESWTRPGWLGPVDAAPGVALSGSTLTCWQGQWDESAPTSWYALVYLTLPPGQQKHLIRAFEALPPG